MKGIQIKKENVKCGWLFLSLLSMIGLYSLSLNAAIVTVGAAQNGNTTGSDTATETITHVGAGSTASRNNCGNINPGIAAGNAGDLLIAVALVRETAATVTMDANWTQLYTENHGVGGTQDLEAYIFYRIATNTALDTNTITSAGAGNCRSLIGQISRFSGVDTVSPFETVVNPGVNSSTQNTNTVITGTQTTAAATAMSVAVTFINDNATVTEANSFTQSFDFASTTGRDSAISLNYRLETVAGVKGAFTWSQNLGADESIGVLFALTPKTATGLTINVPAGTTTGHVMVAAIAVRPSTLTIGAPTGWTLLRRTDQAAGNSNSQAIYYRLATASEPAAYTWDLSGGAVTGTAGGIITYAGVDTSNPINVSGGNVTPNSLSHTANSVTTTVTDTMLISTHSYSSAQIWTPPAGMTERVDVFSTAAPAGGGIAIEMNDELLVAAAATGNRTAVAAASADTGVGQLLALTPLAPPAPIVEYHMDETSWGTVLDTSGNGNDGTVIVAVPSADPANPVASPALAGDPGTCGYGDFPNNTNNNITAIDTTITPANAGSISFWFNNKANWNAGGDRLLFDASINAGNNNADKQFFLIRRNNNNGSLRFVLEDSADLNMQADALNLNFLAGTWVHIAVTWDLPNDRMQIYVNGSLSATDTTNMANTIGALQSIYIGDQRTTGVGGSGWGNDAVNGFIDEFKIYNQVINQAQIDSDMAATHPCIDHYSIDFPVTPAVTCEGLEVDIEAHADAIDHAQLVRSQTGALITVTANVATAGDVVWQEGAGGNGSLLNGVPGAGQAQYTFDGTETSVKLFMRYPNAELNVSVDVSDGTVSDTEATEDPTVEFVLAAFRFLDDTDANVGTQIAGKPSSAAPGSQTLQLRAVQTNTTTLECEAALTGLAIPVDLAYQCNNPTTCATANNGMSVTAAETLDIDDVLVGFTSINMDFNTAGIAEFSFSYADAGEISLLAQKAIAADPLAIPPTTALTIQGTSSAFVVRPFAFDIDSGGLRAADWGDDAMLNGSAGDISYAVDASGSVFAKAGNSVNNFPLTIRAVVWESADDGDNNGIANIGANLTDNSLTPNFGHETATETVEITHTLVRPGTPGGTGTLYMGSGLDFSGASGSIPTNLAFDEVGIINLTASLSSGNYLSGGSDVTATHENFGRFTPDRLTITDNSPSLTNTCAAGSFTYQDEQFFYGTAPTLTITAVNEAGGTTLNYGDEDPSNPAERFWKLPTELVRTYVDQAGAAATGAGLDAATVNLSGDLNYDGTADLSLANTAFDRDSFSYTRVSEEGPFPASFDAIFAVQTSPIRSLIDADGVCFDGDADGVCETDGADDYNNLSLAGAGSPLSGASLRFGRLNIGTAVGSELLPLNPPLVVEYHNGTGFVRNTDDNACTSLDLVDHVRLENTGTAVAGNSIMTIGSGDTSITTFNSPLLAGDSGMEFKAPLTGNTGFVNIFGNLDCSDLTVACIGSTLFSHLLYDWEEDGGFDENPSGRIDFGVFAGASEFIYSREPW